MRRAVRERLVGRRQRRPGLRLHGGALRRLRAAEAALQDRHLAAVAGRAAAAAGRRRRSCCSPRAAAARRPAPPPPLSDEERARLDVAAGRADARIPPRPAHHGDGRRAAGAAAARHASRRPTASTASSRSIATSWPRSSASAPPARCPRAEATAARIEIERRILAAAEHAPPRGRRPTPTLHSPPAARACARDPAVRARPLSADRPSRPARGAVRRRHAARPRPPTSRLASQS